jgi:hypothetical protein
MIRAAGNLGRGCGILEETRRRIVAHGSDLRRSRGERACVVAHRDE